MVVRIYGKDSFRVSLQIMIVDLNVKERCGRFCIYLCTAAPQPGELRAIILGDWGERLLQGQDRVAAAMATWAAENNPAFIITTGDNIYPRGINSPDDPQMDRKWRNVYNNESLVSLDWYVSVGNHDFGDWDGVEWNEVGFSALEPRWILPHLWHDLHVDLGDHSVYFVIIDTESFGHQINNYTDMLVWMDEKLRDSTADFKFVVGHRHCFSSGDVLYGAVTTDILNVLVPIMERHHVDAYIAGHDHNLQHIRNISGEGMDYIVNGAGGSLLSYFVQSNADYIRDFYQMDTVFFRMTYGFITLTSSRFWVVFDFYDEQAQLIYTFTRNRFEVSPHKN